MSRRWLSSSLNIWLMLSKTCLSLDLWQQKQHSHSVCAANSGLSLTGLVLQSSVKSPKKTVKYFCSGFYRPYACPTYCPTNSVKAQKNTKNTYCVALLTKLAKVPYEELYLSLNKQYHTYSRVPTSTLWSEKCKDHYPTSATKQYLINTVMLLLLQT